MPLVRVRDEAAQKSYRNKKRLVVSAATVSFVAAVSAYFVIDPVTGVFLGLLPVTITSMWNLLDE
jgi:hypothetical protein|tara:strand:+ start:784 stop:978 length:195 start_codon:yes stop_codon:yes gene_type:complete